MTGWTCDYCGASVAGPYAQCPDCGLKPKRKEDSSSGSVAFGPGPTIQLTTGQTARITEGRVLPPPAEHHYKLTVEHRVSGELAARSGSYDDLIPFLKQLEEMDYRLRSLEREPGVVPQI